MTHLKRALMRHEGLRFKPYMDTQGYVTIGYGHKIKSWTRKRAEYELGNDIITAWLYASRFSWFEELNPVRQEVVINMIFNLGYKGFKTFKRMIAALKRANYLAASIEMNNSLWAHQVKGRARELSLMMYSGKRN